MKIGEIPIHELLKDKKESEEDILNCQKAINVGVFTYGDEELVQERLNVNKEIILKIDEEVRRRNECILNPQL